MSEIAEIRKLFQDLIAPDVKSIATDLAAFKINVDHQFKSQKDLIELQISGLRASMEARFDSVEALEQARYAAVIAKMETIKSDLVTMEAVQTARHEAILKALDIDKRLERVEAFQAATSAA